MADTDNKEVFGKGCPMEGSEPTGSGNLIAHNDDDTTELDQAIDEAPLMGSTPLIKRPHEAGDGMHPLEDFGTGTWTHHPALPKMFIKPEIYNGRSDWADYLSHFNKCAILGGWNDQSKCIMLALNLRAAARRFYAGLSQEESDDYSRLTAALKRRFGGKHRQDAWLFQLEMRKRKSDESILELLDDIWQMTQRAYCNYDHRSLDSKISSSTVSKDLLSKMEEHSLSETISWSPSKNWCFTSSKIDSWQNGIFTQGQIEGITFNFLVDTGSVVTIISAAALQRIPQHPNQSWDKLRLKYPGWEEHL